MSIYNKKISEKSKNELHKLMRHFQIEAAVSNDKEAYQILKAYNDELNRVLPKIKEQLYKIDEK
jgi:hypothetical protein